MTEQKKDNFITLGFQDEMLILAVLVIAAGIGFTDAYYSKFGFTYDVLDFSFVKVLYQGVKVSLHNHIVLGLYIFQLALIIFSKWIKSDAGLKTILSFTYIFTFVMIYLVYSISRKEGIRIAYDDMRLEKSSLPKVHSLVSKRLTIEEPEDKYLLFSANQDFVIVFTPLTAGEKQVFPNLKRIPKDQIEIFQTYQ